MGNTGSKCRVTPGMGGNAAEGGYKPAVQRMEVEVMARITDSNDWFGIWFEDKKSIINTMIKNMAADLDAGYNYFGTCIRKQQENIETYKAKFDEEMVFSSSFLSKDYTRFRYTLIANCEDGAVNLRLCRISYEYNVNKKEIYTAEEWITDSKAINKKGTKLYPLSGKFRRKTIDRVEEIFRYFSQTIK